MISVRGLSKRFGPIHALRDVTFDVHTGEVLGLIGPNGAGKSTLFLCLAGLLAADAGSVTEGATELAPHARSSRLLFLPDGITPWEHQRAGWVLDFLADAVRSRNGWRHELADVLRLDELLRTRMGQLSKGQRKRVLLAALLCAPQPVLLMDEPFDGLDLRHSRELSAYFRTRVREGDRTERVTLCVSIHSMHEAAKLCHRLVLLSEGHVAAQGTLRELSHQTGETDLEEIFLELTRVKSGGMSAVS